MTGVRLESGGRELLDQLFDKWSLLVLDVLCHGPRRFGDIRRELAPVTSKSLTQALRRLERNGVISRAVIGTYPLAVEYAITPLGRGLEQPLQQMLLWVSDRLGDVEQARLSFDVRLAPREGSDIGRSVSSPGGRHLGREGQRAQ